MTIINQFEREKYQLLNKLLIQTQTLSNQEQQKLAINQIAETILRSRPLCRRFNGTPLRGVYKQIYQKVKAQLVLYLNRYLLNNDTGQTQQELSKNQKLKPDYLYVLQNQFFQIVLDDSQLKEMGLTAQRYPLNSELRAYALNELIKAIQLSGRICRPHTGKFSPSLYQMLYEEALTETWTYICLNIDLYDPNRGNKKFMNWVNYKLDKQILKCYEQYTKNTQYQAFSYQDLEKLSQPEQNPDLVQLLRDFIRRDPDKMFSNTHIRYRPDASFERIALAKFSGQSWEEMSQQFNIPIPTLSSFYNRWCRRFAPLLETELKKYF